MVTSFEGCLQYLGSQIKLEEFENLSVKREVNEKQI